MGWCMGGAWHGAWVYDVVGVEVMWGGGKNAENITRVPEHFMRLIEWTSLRGHSLMTSHDQESLEF